MQVKWSELFYCFIHMQKHVCQCYIYIYKTVSHTHIYNIFMCVCETVKQAVELKKIMFLKSSICINYLSDWDSNLSVKLQKLFRKHCSNFLIIYVLLHLVWLACDIVCFYLFPIHSVYLMDAECKTNVKIVI